MMMKFIFHNITLVVVAILIYRFYGRYYDSTTCANGVGVDVGRGDPSIKLNLKFQYPVNNENNYIDNSIANIKFNDNNDDSASTSTSTSTSTGTGNIESDYYNKTNEYYEYKYQYEYKDPCKLFSSEYIEARTKFRNAVNLYKNKNKNDDDDDDDDDDNTVELLSFPVVTSGVSGDLTIDVAILHGNTKELGTIIHSSGVHGIEGFAGSAIQLAILELLTASESESESESDSDESQQQQRIERRPTIILMHAINPVGMKEYRRCNENNVDLNRNCIITHNNDNDNDTNDEQYTSFKDFISKRDPNIAGYDDFRHLFVPEDNDDSSIEGLSLYDTTIGYYIKAIPAIWKYGMIAIKRAMVAGQYHDQGGLNYGGQEPQKSIQHAVEFLFKDRKELLNNSKSVVWIDVHTGLGPFGKDSIDYRRVDEEEQLRQALRLEPRDYFSSTAYSVTTIHDSNSAESESNNSADAFKGYDLSKGMLMEYIADSYHRKMLTSSNGSRSGIFMVQEFGTLPTVLVGRALILDNMLYQKYLKQKHQKQQKNINEQEQYDSYRSPFLKYAFYPQSIEWRKSILQRGVSLFLESIEYSKANSRVLLKGKQKVESVLTSF
jgi:hypothetical protein